MINIISYKLSHEFSHSTANFRPIELPEKKVSYVHLEKRGVFEKRDRENTAPMHDSRDSG